MTLDDIDPPADGYIRLYRACNEYNLGRTQLGAEIPALHPRDPQSDVPEFEHIQYGYDIDVKTAYISFTCDLKYALFYAVKQRVFFHDNREVIAFDIEEKAVRDVSSYRDAPEIVKNFASKAQERLVYGSIEIRKPAWRIRVTNFEEVLAGAEDLGRLAFKTGWQGIDYVKENVRGLHADPLFPFQHAIDEAEEASQSDAEDDDELELIETFTSILNV